jgi:hypothetical protein
VNEYHEDTWIGRNEGFIALLAIASFVVAILVIIVFVSRRDRQRDELCVRSGGSVVSTNCHTEYTQSCVPIQNGTTITQICSPVPFEACDHACVGGGGEAQPTEQETR